MIKTTIFNISFKISVLVIGIGLLVITALTFSFYNVMIEEVEENLGKKLESIAKTSSLLITEKDHQTVLSLYLKQNQNIYSNDAFKRVQKTLRDVKKINALTTEIYTIVLPKWADGNMIYVTMSDEEPFTGNASPSTPIVRKVFTTRKAAYSKIYTTEEGRWISGVVPLLNQKGDIFAALEIDYQADKEVQSAKNNFFNSLLKISAIIGVFLLIGGAFLGYVLAWPIKKLSRLALKVAKGDLNVESNIESTDEIGVLSSSFNLMTSELRAKNREINHYVKNLEKTIEERTASVVLEKKFTEKILQSMQDMLIVLNNSGTITNINAVVVEKLSIPEEQIIGRNIRQFILPEEIERITKLKSGEDDHFETSFQVDPSLTIPVMMTRSRMELEEQDKKEFIIYTMKDLTKSKKAELKIAAQKAIVIESSRLASLGEMSSGIAHEINNPVTIIDGQLRRLKDYIVDEDISVEEEIGLVDKVHKNLHRVVKIVNGLRRISRNTKGDPFETKTTKDVVAELVDLFSEKYKNSDVIMDVSKLGDNTIISVKEADIIQVLLNLVSNAYDAIYESSANKWIRIEEEVLEDRVLLKVIDSGSGVPRDIVAKLFQPFFTTKDVGQGTGIGLSIAKKIMEEHKGDLFYDTDSELSCFVLSFPKNI